MGYKIINVTATNVKRNIATVMIGRMQIGKKKEFQYYVS